MRATALVRARSLACVGTVLLAVSMTTGPAVSQDAEKSLESRVNVAIDSGLDWLRSRQRSDGSFDVSPRVSRAKLPDEITRRHAARPWEPGVSGLCVFTLAECGEDEDREAVARGLAYLREFWIRSRDRDDEHATEQDGVNTYFVSLCLLALDSHYNDGAHQSRPGAATPGKSGASLMGRRDFKWAQQLCGWLNGAQDTGVGSARGRAGGEPPSGGVGYLSPIAPLAATDMSCGQFAAMGWKAASRLGVDVPDATWQRLAEHLLGAQETGGAESPRVVAGFEEESARGHDRKGETSDERARARGWGYGARGVRPAAPRVALGSREETSRSMTSAGVASLLLCRSEIEGRTRTGRRLRERIEGAVHDGLAWLSRDIRASGEKGDDPNPLGRALSLLSDPLEDFYGLYALERAGVLAQAPILGNVDWWRLGAERLVDRQEQDGKFLSKAVETWSGIPEIDTCFALLFLRRSAFGTPQPSAETPRDR